MFPPATGGDVVVLTGTERFEIRRCLGSGSFGVVYEAFDRERGTRVALKLPHAGTAQGLYLFKQEFRSLADITHPNLASLFELLAAGDRWFFTMELVDGAHLLDFLRLPAGAPGTADHSTGDGSGGPSSDRDYERTGGPRDGAGHPPEPLQLPAPPPDYDRVRSAFRQLAEGLQALHAGGMLHRDLKPSNVLVTRAGRVVILDFGLAADLEDPGSQDVPGAMAGTPAYMSPERIAGHRTTAASDWYSVGVLLYQSLTGRLPFAGGDRLAQKLQQEPLEPKYLVPGTPGDLEALCLGLLRRDPEARLRGPEVLAALQHAAPALPPEARPRSAALVGREQELEELLEGFRLARGRRVVAALLHGESGCGKTTLARGFLRELRRLDDRAVLLQGRCYEQESVPFNALDSLVDALSEHLRRLPAAEAGAFLPRNVQALARLFPVLSSVPLVAGLPEETAVPDAQELRRRAFGALREVLRRMALARPVVLLIDDVQWGDRDSAVLLAELLRAPDPPRVMLVLCYRSADAQVSPVLREFLPRLAESVTILQDVELRPLSQAEARDLAIALLPSGCPEQAEWIAAESGGNPFFVQELVQHLGGTAPHGPEESGRRLDAYIRTRVEALPADARSILQTVAVAGYPLEWELVRRAAAVGAESLAALTSLRAGRLIRMRAGAGRRTLEPYHDRIRTAVVQSTGEAGVRSLNVSLGEALEAAGSTDAQALARHFEAGGVRDKAADYIVRAAAHAESSLAFDQAAAMYRKALELRTDADPEDPSLWRRLGDALAKAGRNAEAAEAYLRATEGSATAEANRLQRRAAEEFLRCGNIQAGLSTLDRLLVLAGARLPSSRTAAVVSFLWRRLRLAVRGLEFRERTPEEIGPEALERVDIHWAVAMGLGPVDVLRAADFQTRQLLLTLEAGEPFRVVRALAHETILVAASGNRTLERTRALSERTAALAERVGHPNSMARSLMASGIVETIQGRWRASAELLERAEAMFRQHCTGMDYELRLAQHQALLARLVLGDLPVIRERLPVLLQEAREKGDLFAATNLRTSVSYVLSLARDDPGQAWADLRAAIQAWPSCGFHLQHYYHFVSLANTDLYAEAYAKARHTVTVAERPLERSLLLKLQPILITVLELRARADLALAARDPGSRPARMRSAARAVRALRRERTAYGGALALKIEAMAAVVEGRPDDAQALFHRSELTLDACDMPLHAMAVRRARGRLAGEAGQDLVASADAWMQDKGIQNPARFAAMHVPLAV